MEQRLENIARFVNGGDTAVTRRNMTHLLTRFFGALDQAFALPDAQQNALRNDFIRGIDVLSAMGMPLSEILNRLNPENLRGFYAHRPQTFYPLDDGAKQYPLTMRQGQMAMFRLAAVLDAPVNPVLLQLALTFTLRRFPHYASRLRRGAFWYYLQPHTARYTVNPDQGEVLRAVDVSDESEQLFRVLHKGNRVSVELFHILTDGMGGMMFLKSLLAEYYRLQGEDMTEDDPQILDTTACIRAEDMENGFSRFRGRERGDRLIGSPAVQVPAERLRNGACRVEEYVLSAEELRQRAHAYGVSVTALMSAAVLTAIHESVQADRGRYQLQIPVNLRTIFSSCTLRNFSWYSSLSMDAANPETGRELACNLHGQIKTMTARPALERNISAAQRVIRCMRYVPLQWKTALIRTTYQMTGDFFFTSTLSNLGVICLPAPLGTHVTEIAAALGPSPSNPWIFGLATVHGRAILSVTCTADDTAMANRLIKAAHTYGLSIMRKG